MKTPVVYLCLLLLPIGCDALTPKAVSLNGAAEDLWGRKVDLAQFTEGVTLILPFSPANCGYCLFDGEFVDRNYLAYNAASGGSNFYQCLFNPQLDIYTYTKHYRSEETPVLTFPPSLHRYHQNGFPSITGFRDGDLLYRGGLHPYAAVLGELRDRLWPGREPGLVLTSPQFMAGDFVYWNKRSQSLVVVADGDERGVDRMRRLNEKRPDSVVPAKYERELTAEDLQKTLLFQGVTERFSFEALVDSPVRIDSTSIQTGEYRFPKADVSLVASFPNPHNPERYLVLRLQGSLAAPPPNTDWADFAVYAAPGDDGSQELILHGLFDKEAADRWKFSPALSFARAAAGRFCSGGSCPAPVAASGGRTERSREIRVTDPLRTPAGAVWTAGISSCRFPAVATDREGVAWVAWEEEGDILLISLSRTPDQRAVVVEGGSSDSFNPVVVADGALVWVFYLNDQDGFYRVRARYFDGLRQSDEILISDAGAFDALTPAAVADGMGTLVVAWSEWKANQRFMRYRRIEDRVLGEVESVAIKRPDFDYTNAWSPSLVLDSQGRVRGAWNQHYPATLGVCAGNLVDEASSVTRLNGGINENEKGGYPSMVIDSRGRSWVFWETFGWDPLSGKPQRILASCDEAGDNTWSLPYTLTVDDQTSFNQAPRAAVDSRGVIWTVWSGRDADGERPWGVYLSRFTGEEWSVPERLSDEGESARAPAIAAGREDELWIAWHSGVGEEMRIRALEYSAGLGVAAGAESGRELTSLGVSGSSTPGR